MGAAAGAGADKGDVGSAGAESADDAGDGAGGDSILRAAEDNAADADSAELGYV